MRISAEITLKVTKVVVITLMTLFFVFLVSQKVVTGQVLFYKIDFCTGNRFVVGPYPEGRVVAHNVGLTCSYDIIQEPVYFQLNSPRHFSVAQVKIYSLIPEGLDVSLGVRQAGDDWSYDFQPLNSKLKEQVVSFDLTKADFTDNKLQLIISAPGLGDSQEKIQLNGVEVQLVK